MQEIQDLINNGREALEQIFAKNGVKAPVTVDNVTNALIAVPGVKADVAAKFEGFGGSENEDSYDDLFGKKIAKGAKKTPEEKAARNEKIKGLFNKGLNAINTAKGVKDSLSTGSQNVAEPEPEEKSKAPKKIFGLDAWIFWGIMALIFLIVVFIIVKVVKK